jgi:starch synthase
VSGGMPPKVGLTFFYSWDYHNFKMTEKLTVAYVSPEVSPFAKSGEIADVASSLPKYLSALGVEVHLFTPMYRKPEIESVSKELLISDLLVPLGDKKVKARVFKTELGKFDI